MSLAGELRKLASRLDTPGAKEARKLRVPLELHRLFQRVKHLTAIGSVLDVGANQGQYSRWAAACFPDAEIHAFEPLPVCLEKLRPLRNALPRLRIHEIALGDDEGSVEMYQNNYAPSSSLLPMEERHRQLWPKTAGESKITVPVRKLDSVAREIRWKPPCFLKLDVQGFELHVLRGAEETLKQTDVVQAETLFEPLYSGQPEFLDVMAFLHARGFRFMEFVEERRIGPLGWMVYADAVFVRRELRPR